MLIDMKINVNDFDLYNVEVTALTEFNTLPISVLLLVLPRPILAGILGYGDSDGLDNNTRNVKVFTKSVFSTFDVLCVCRTIYFHIYLVYIRFDCNL